MSEEDLRATVLDALLEVAPDIDADRLDPANAFRDQFDFDSMDVLNFATALHHRFGVDIPERDYPALGSLDGAVAYVQAQRAKESRA